FNHRSPTPATGPTTGSSAPILGPGGGGEGAGARPGERGGGDGGGGAGEGVGAGLGLGEGDDVADGGGAGEEHVEAGEAEGEAAPRGGAVGQAPEEEAEAVLGLLGADAEGLEDAALDVGAVDTDAARPELVAVEDQVVGAGGGLLGGVREGVGPLAGGGGERVVGRVPAAGLLVPLEPGELGDRGEGAPAPGDQAALGGQPDPQVAEDGLGHRGAVGGDQQQVARPGPGDLAQGVAFGVGEELVQGRAQPLGLDRDPGQALGPPGPGLGGGGGGVR